MGKTRIVNRFDKHAARSSRFASPRQTQRSASLAQRNEWADLLRLLSDAVLSRACVLWYLSWRLTRNTSTTPPWTRSLYTADHATTAVSRGHMQAHVSGRPTSAPLVSWRWRAKVHSTRHRRLLACVTRLSHQARVRLRRDAYAVARRRCRWTEAEYSMMLCGCSH
jgi:hypothetical protein